MTQIDNTELMFPQDTEVYDESEQDETVPPTRYDITSYGIDFDVEGIVRRLKREEIFIPEFQRNFIWTIVDASRFIESLLLGLPVPGVFLAQDSSTGKLLVIDGQQRLKSLLFFYTSTFNPSPQEKAHRVFKLTNVQEEFKDLTYESLSERDRINLDNSVIHATIIKQDFPPNDDTSIYHIFDRLNRGGRRLFPQELRCAIYHGTFIDTIKTLNEFEKWREIFGKISPRLKDQELILRFLALYFNSGNYERPMDEFLNKFAKTHREPSEQFLIEADHIFKQTIEAFQGALGRRSFRPGNTINAAVFDSMTVGFARRIHSSSPPSKEQIREIHARLLDDDDYKGLTSRSTGDKGFVIRRLEKATAYFALI